MGQTLRLVVGFGALIVTICWWNVIFPPNESVGHCWKMRVQTGGTIRACGDHIVVTNDPVLSGYSIVEVRDYDDRLLGSYKWIYAVKETR